MKKTLTTIFLTACALCASATDYYVSPDGAGTKDGTSVDTPMSCADFVAMFDTADKASAIANKSSVYFAAGTYLITSPLYIKNGLYLYGNTGEERTVFSGNLDGSDEPKANTGDLSCFFNIETTTGSGSKEKEVIINNIDFDVLYFSQDGEGKVAVGALFVDNSGYVEVNRCSFTNLVNTGQGGNALLSRRSMVNFYDCIFTDNSAQMKGVIARLLNTDKEREKGYTTFERCLIANNRITTGNSSYDGGMIYFQSGMKLTLKTSVVRDNISGGKAAAIWDANEPKQLHNRALEITNTLMYNNKSSDNTNILLHASNTSVPVNSVIHDDTSVSGAINISSVGVGTYYLSLPFTMPVGVVGKTFSSITGSRLIEGTTYKAGDVVPAGTALLVEGAEGTYHPIVAEDDNSAPTNMLSGSDLGATTTGEGKHYKLANGESGLAFYYGATDGAAFTNAAHKAWLVVPEAEARFFFSFSDDEVTGLERITKQTAPQDGKFMENGRMVILKNGVKYNAVGQKL